MARALNEDNFVAMASLDLIAVFDERKRLQGQGIQNHTTQKITEKIKSDYRSTKIRMDNHNKVKDRSHVRRFPLNMDQDRKKR